MHLDLDAFFASVEQLDHPEWRGLPVIVGAKPGGRGVVSTCSYEARRFGVRSAQPISEAYRACPQGIFVRPRMERYAVLSRHVMTILRNAAPRFAQMSVDEAYLDLQGTERLLGPAPEIARQVKDKVFDETGLRVSVGLAPTWYLAKIASDWGKPDGLFILEPDQIDPFLDRLPLKKLHGAGGKTRERLEALGIDSVAELRTWTPTQLENSMGTNAGKFLWLACRGQADYDPFRESKSHSLSAETTFGEDLTEQAAVEQALHQLCQEVAFRARDEGWKSRHPHLKLRWSDFTTLTAQVTLPEPVTSTAELFHHIRKLLGSRWTSGRGVRLVGVGLGNLEAADGIYQGDLFQDDHEKQNRVEAALAEYRKKHPSGAQITRASLMGRPKRHFDN